MQQGESATARPVVAASSSGSNVAAPPTSANDSNIARLQSAQASTAGQAADSIRDIEGQRAAADAAREQELADLIAQAKAAEASRKWTVARIYYEQAARRAQGTQQRELQAKVRELGGK
jgi:hypothetical protein